MNNVAEAARGKWRGILPAFGIDSRYLTKNHGPCPMCGGKDRFLFDDKEGRGTFYCNQCKAGTGFQLIASIKSWSMKQVYEEVGKMVGTIEKVEEPRAAMTDAQRKEALNKTWSEARPVVEDDETSLYLKARTGNVWFSSALRTHQSLWHPEEKQSYPAMIAKITDIDNKPVSIHRTYIKDGKKAPVAKSKMLMAGTIPDGSAIRLLPYSNILGIAEGIETALAASAIFDVPVWAAVSGAIMAKWKPPLSVEKIIIFGDNDQNYIGQLTAYKLAYALRKDYDKQYDITVAIPNIRGADWNDVLMINGTEKARQEAVFYCPSAFRILPV